jgi:hypothetical protein
MTLYVPVNHSFLLYFDFYNIQDRGKRERKRREKSRVEAD